MSDYRRKRLSPGQIVFCVVLFIVALAFWGRVIYRDAPQEPQLHTWDQAQKNSIIATWYEQVYPSNRRQP